MPASINGHNSTTTATTTLMAMAMARRHRMDHNTRGLNTDIPVCRDTTSLSAVPHPISRTLCTTRRLCLTLLQHPPSTNLTISLSNLTPLTPPTPPHRTPTPNRTPSPPPRRHLSLPIPKPPHRTTSPLPPLSVPSLLSPRTPTQHRPCPTPNPNRPTPYPPTRPRSPRQACPTRRDAPKRSSSCKRERRICATRISWRSWRSLRGMWRRRIRISPSKGKG
jgi:hypothetical protein